MDFQEHTAVVVEEDEDERKEKGGWIYQTLSFLAVRRNLPWSWILDKVLSNLKGIYVRESVSNCIRMFELNLISFSGINIYGGIGLDVLWVLIPVSVLICIVSTKRKRSVECLVLADFGIYSSK